jgi:L-ascorbate metabolism protein UlaG (beta-lactamase superfamily)
MKLTYCGHSCFSVLAGAKTLLFDPFITPNPLAKDIELDQINPDYILLSHGHADHVADCVTLAKKSNATVICSWEIHEWLNRKGVNNTHPMNTGGRKTFDTFSVKCTVAQHSSGLPDGTYGGNPMGFIITINERSFYYSGDTGLTLDMQLIPRWAKLDFAILPIGDNFTMGAADATECARMIACNKILGVHYDTFGFIKIDHNAARQAFKDAGLELILANIGETLDL